MIANVRDFRRRLGFAIDEDIKRSAGVEIRRNVAPVMFDLHPRIQMVEPKAILGEIGLLEQASGPPTARGYPGLVAPAAAKTVDKMVLHADIAPSLLELCGAKPLDNIQGKSWVKLAREGDGAWRTAWLYEYNYEKHFPYTPNIRGVRTDDFAYMRYPHGDGSPDRHKAELYDLKNDPDQLNNLIAAPGHKGRSNECRAN